MPKIHFIKAYSRIGINFLPFGQNTVANGVEEAPDFILKEHFLNNFKNLKVSSFGFLEPEEIDPLNYFQTICEESIKFRDFIMQNHKDDDTLVIVGGDHSVTFASILYDLDIYGNDLGIIHFDSHGDINLYKDSPSKNFHGMYLRILFDKFDLKYFDELVPNKLPTTNLLFIGNMELDSEENEFIIKNNVYNISSEKIKKSKANNLEILDKFIYSNKHIHISFDVDVFDKNLAPATGTPSENGFNNKDIFEILEIIKKAKSKTIDLAEVNPRKKGAEITVKLAQEVILKLIK